MIKKWSIRYPAVGGEEERRAYVYLPTMYEADPDRRYPVLYMFDGQNVFFDEDATYGKSWGVADYLERAIAAMADNRESCAELLKGVELTQNELAKVFEKFGIKRFNHIGEKFDPNFERVVQEIEDKKAKSGTILAELQAGYTIHDRILREAMVIVAR